MSDVVLCLGFDLFFKPKLNEAAKAAGVELRYQEGGAFDRVVADVSAPGVEERLRALRAARPDVPILACYPHVEEHRAEAVRALGGVAITRGAFAQRLPDVLAGRW
ncbi:MAG: hypothetical protein QOE90_108 [Thermoplasmata archaeon]|jgi:hypothetical protein|nr:hypothetical protein [Thermoplasmata archaeon]